MTTTRAALGASGERVAARFLLDQGWQIIRRNWRLAGGEIDLLARDPGGELVVVEVKARQTVGQTDPTANLNSLKKRQLTRLAQVVSDRYPEASVRVDAVTVIFHPLTINHYDDILN